MRRTNGVGDQWVDPRGQPTPPARQAARPTGDPSQVSALIELCRTGRLYSVERWIAAGHPIQVAHEAEGPWHYLPTPLSVAIESGQYDLVFLLLCNGYRTELEPQSPLNLALRRRAWDYVDLLLEWGADPTAANPRAVLDTYQLPMMERFSDLGLDLTRDRRLAYYLSESTRNKPAYGWAKRHHEDPRVAHALALALGEAVWEGSEKAVALLTWAGADPHRPVPSLSYSDGEDDPDADRNSAIELAVMFGHGRLLKYLRPDPSLDDFEGLWGSVCDPDAVDRLFDLRPPTDWSKTIVRNVSRITWGFGDRSGNRECLGRIFEHHWGRLTKLERRGCQDLRRDLLKMHSSSDFSWLVEKLAMPRHCDEAIFAELVRTPAMRTRMEGLGLGRLVPQKASKRTPKRPAHPPQTDPRARSAHDYEAEWLSRLDPETRAAVLRERISREQLYGEVWAEPATKVATRYGVSDVAVAKWCKQLNVPRPGRGYWARKSAGHRVKQAPLPEAERGHQTYVRRPRPRERRIAPPTKIPGLELFENPIAIPGSNEHDHPLVEATRKALEGASEERGLIRPEGPAALDIRVGRASVDRALRLMNALAGALDSAGFTVEAEAIPGGQGYAAGCRTFAAVHGERVAFSMTEQTEAVERAPNDDERAEMRRNPWKKGPFYAHKPTGVLSLRIEGGGHRERHRRTWTDSSNRRLEDCLYWFVRSLLLTAERRRRPRREGEE